MPNCTDGCTHELVRTCDPERKRFTPLTVHSRRVVKSILQDGVELHHRQQCGNALITVMSWFAGVIITNDVMITATRYCRLVLAIRAMIARRSALGAGVL